MIDRALVDRLISEYEILGRTVREIDAAVPKDNIVHVRPGDNVQAAIDSMEQQGGSIIMATGNYDITPRLIYRNRIVTVRGDGPVTIRGLSGAIRSGNFMFHNINFVNPQFTSHVELGKDKNEMTTEADIPIGFGFFNCNFTGPCRRGIAANCGDLIVDTCRFENYFEAGKDSQAIGGWNGSRNIRVINSFLEAASENFMFGGNDCAIEAMIPRDVLLENCELSKRVEWKTRNYNMKCLLEMKNILNLTVRRCHLHGTWKQAWGNAPAIVLKSANQDGSNPYARTENALFEYNRIDDVGSYITLIGRADSGRPSGIMRNIMFRNNLFELMNAEPDGRTIRIAHAPDGVTFDHNSFFEARHSVMEEWEGGHGLPLNVSVTNNIAKNGSYGLFPAEYRPQIYTHNAIQRGTRNPSGLDPSNKLFDDVRTDDLSSFVTTDGLPVGANFNA